MCEVCAIFGIGEHWSDAAHTKDAMFPAADIQRYRTARRQRIALINSYLSIHALSCGDWDGEQYFVEDRQGRRELAPDLGAVWAAAERLGGERLDPLALT